MRSLACLTVHKIVGETQPLTPEILGQLHPPSSKTPTYNRYYFVRNAKAVTPSEKCSIMNRKFTGSFPISLRSTAYVCRLTLSRLKGVQKRKVAVYCIKVDFSRRKTATKFLCEKTVSDVLRYSVRGLSSSINFSYFDQKGPTCISVSLR